MNCNQFFCLDKLLVPVDPLTRDVRSLAGDLGFSNADISYIIHKPYPFVYMYDQWLKIHKQDAKLSVLIQSLDDIKRFDAVEIVKKAVEGTNFLAFYKNNIKVNNQNTQNICSISVINNSLST